MKQNGELNYPQLVSMFTDKYTCTLYDRLSVVLNKVALHNIHGLNINDLPFIIQFFKHSLAAHSKENTTPTKQKRSNSTNNNLNNSTNPINSSNYHSSPNLLISPLIQILDVIGNNGLILERAGDSIRNRETISTLIVTIMSFLSWKGALDLHIVCVRLLGNLLNLNPAPNLVSPTLYHEIIYENKIVDKIIDTLNLSPPFSPNLHFACLTTIKSFTNNKTTLKYMTRDDSHLIPGLVTVLKNYGGKNSNQIAANYSSNSIYEVPANLILADLEILWVILEKSVECRSKPCFGDLIFALKEVLDTITTVNVLSGYEKEITHEILIISGILAVASLHHEFFLESNFLKLLLDYLIDNDEQKTDTPRSTTKPSLPYLSSLDKSQNLTLQEGFEIKKLVLNIVFELCSHRDCLSLIVSHHFLELLLDYLSNDDLNINEISTSSESNKQSNFEWKQRQKRELQQVSVQQLFHIVPLCPISFQRINGVQTLINFMNTCGSRRDFELLKLVLGTVSNIVLFFKQEFVQKGLIDILIEFLSPSPHFHPTELKFYSLSILGKICKGDFQNQKEIGEKNGIEVISAYIRLPPQMRTDQTHSENKALFSENHTNILNITSIPSVSQTEGSTKEKEKLVISALICLWDLTLGNTPNLQKFLEYPVFGVKLLLDLIEVCPQTMQSLILGCLDDLMGTTNDPFGVAISQVKEWKSERFPINSTQLLIHLWKQEENRLGVLCDKEGAIMNLSRPLESERSKLAKEKWRNERNQKILEKNDEESEIDEEKPKLSLSSSKVALISALNNQVLNPILMEAIDEIDLRDKIYSLFLKIGFQNHNNLTVLEQVTLMLIEQYLNLRIGEKWQDVTEELFSENVQPTLPDLEIINIALAKSTASAQNLHNRQRELIQGNIQIQLQSERAMYEQIKLHNQLKREVNSPRLSEVSLNLKGDDFKPNNSKPTIPPLFGV